MSKMRYILVKVEDWLEQDKKIYLLTTAKNKYRYVGRRSLKQVKTEFPKGTFLKVGIVLNENMGLLHDDHITGY